jgi:outer membrane autotransporter protein
VISDITGTTGDIIVTAATTTSAAGNVVDSIALTGAGSNISVTNTDGGSAGITNLTVNGTTSIVGNLSIINLMDDEGAATFFTSTGNLTVGGTGTITADADADSHATVTATADFAITGVTTITGSTGNAVLNIGGNATGGNIVFAGTATTGIVNINGAGSQTIANVITGGTNLGNLNITDATADTAADLDTFTGGVGTAGDLKTLTVGSSTLAGNAQFQAGAEANAITIFGGDHANETGLAEFQSHVTATAILLQDATGVTTMTVNATNGDKTVAGTIDGGAHGEGTLAVIDDDADAAPDVITFSGIIGGTARVKNFNVGNTTQPGNVLMGAAATVDNFAIQAGNSANEDSLVTTAANVLTCTVCTITASDTADATLTTNAASVLTAMTLDDGSAGNAIINATGNVTVAGAIKGAADGEGTLNLNNATGITLSGIIGGAAGAESLKAINIGTAANAVSTVIFSEGVSTLAMTIGDGLNTNAHVVSFVNAAGTAANTVDGTIDGTAGDTAAITINDADNGAAGQSTTFTGIIGGTSLIETINIGTDNTLFGHGIFNADVTATNINLFGGDHANEDSIADFNGNVTAAIQVKEGTSSDPVLTFSGTAAQTVTGAITAQADGHGVMTITNPAGVTFASTVGDTAAHSLLSLELATGTSAVFSDVTSAKTITLTGTANATFSKAGNDVDTALVPADGSTITLASTIVAGETVFTSVGAHTNATSGTAILKLPSNFTTGTITLVDANADAADANSYSDTAGDTALVDYTIALNGAAIEVTAAAKSAATTASELGITEAAAGGLASSVTAAAGDVTVLDLITTTLNAGGANATELADQVQGTPAGLSATSGAATASTGGAVMSIGSARMASLRNGNAYASTHGAGFNAGSTSQNSSMWMKPFASFGDQTERKSIAGYDSDTYGIALGADTRLNAHTVIGLSFSYADTDVDGKGAGRSHSDISSYQLTAYADYTEKDWYVEGLVGYAYNDMDTSRDITVTNVKAKGETESDQFMVGLTAGMPTQINPGTYFTPTLGLNITHVVNQDYTETGAGVLNLRVNPEDITIAKVHLGGRLHTSVKNSEGTFTPEVRAKLLYDMAGDDGSSSNTFTGGGAAFAVDGLDVVEFATSVGAGIGYTPEFDTGMNLSVNYDAELKENFTGHSANFTLKYAF